MRVWVPLLGKPLRLTVMLVEYEGHLEWMIKEGYSEYEVSILVSVVDSVVYPIDHHLISFLQKQWDCSQN